MYWDYLGVYIYEMFSGLLGWESAPSISGSSIFEGIVGLLFAIFDGGNEKMKILFLI